MKGSVTKRPNGSYLIRISIGRDEKGKRLYHTETINDTSKEAHRRKRELIRQLETGGVVSPDKLSLNQYLDEWLEVAKKPKVSPRTLVGYRELVDRYVRGGIGRMPLPRVSVLHVQGLYSEMSERGLSGLTVRQVHSVLNQAFKQAVRWRKISYNPAADVELPSNRRKKTIRSMDKAEANKFLQAASQTKLGLLFEVALISGMRPGEYLGLTWDCVDWEASSLRVEKAVCRPKGQATYLGPTKTPESRRTIPMPLPTMQKLRIHRAEQRQEMMAERDRWVDHNLVFPNAVGNFWNERNLAQRVYKKVLEAAGLSTAFRLYDLRHTCATLLLLADENAKIVSERLGHANIKLTLDTYQHVLPSMQKRATEKLASILA